MSEKMPWLRRATWALCGFPVLVLASYYATWGAGRLALGHWPRPSVDDPKGIEGGLMWLYDFTMGLLMVGIPVFWLALPVLALVCLYKRPEGWLDRLLEMALALAFFFVLFIFTAWDPHSVIEWFAD